MFLKSSRYYNQSKRETVTKSGRYVTVVSLRRLPTVDGTLVAVKGNDRLDIIADKQYGDPTMFWHIADANTELQANNLLVMRRKRPRIIKVPEK